MCSLSTSINTEQPTTNSVDSGAPEFYCDEDSVVPGAERIVPVRGGRDIDTVYTPTPPIETQQSIANETPIAAEVASSDSDHEVAILATPLSADYLRWRKIIFILASLLLLVLLGLGLTVGILSSGGNNVEDPETDSETNPSVINPSAIIVRRTLRENLMDGFETNLVLQKIKDELHELTSAGPKILCYVNTAPENHETKARAVKETWGSRCDKLVFTSCIDDASIGAIQIPGVDCSYDGLWKKHRESLRYLYSLYSHDYDWFLKADDDTFVIIENLKEYLSSDEVRVEQDNGTPLHIGNRYSMHVDESGVVHDKNNRDLHDKLLLLKFLERNNGEFIFNVGGAGYVMNKVFLERLMQWIDRPECGNTNEISTLLDDAMLSFCSSNFDVTPYPNTRDDLGRERFHQDSPSHMYSMPGDIVEAYHFGKRFTGGFQTGEGCCSTKSISFHHMSPVEMYNAYQFLYGNVASNSTRQTVALPFYLYVSPSDALQLLSQDTWPPYTTVERISDEQRRVVVVIVNCEMIDTADKLAGSMLRTGATNFVLVPLDKVTYKVLLHAYPFNIVPVPPDLLDESIESPSTREAKELVNSEKSHPALIRRFLERGFHARQSDSVEVGMSLLKPSGRLNGITYSCEKKTTTEVAWRLPSLADTESEIVLKTYESNDSRSNQVQIHSAGTEAGRNKTLVAVLGGIRGGEPTWNSLHRHLLDINDADLVLVVGSQGKDQSSSLYQRAKHVWEFPEYPDWNDAFNDYFDLDTNAWGKYLLSEENQPYEPFGSQSSGAILGYARLILADKLEEFGLIEQYSHFVITRSDQYYSCNLRLDNFDISHIWIPTGEDNNGIADRFWVMGGQHVIPALRAHGESILNPEKYSKFKANNVETFLKVRFIEQGLFQHVRRFRRTMFTAYESDNTRWKPEWIQLAFIEDGTMLGYKYADEFYQAMLFCEAAQAVAESSESLAHLEASSRIGLRRRLREL